MPPIGLYVHVPFCVKKCPYCDFYSLPFSEETAEAYTQTVLTEMERNAGPAADTLYFGGGTPVLLGPKRISAILSAARRYFSFAGEATIEANPGAVTLCSLKEYRAAGVSRISFGLQSAIPEELAVLGRIHSAEEAVQSIAWAKEAGFTEISADLMLGVPRQTQDSLARTLAVVEGLDIPHLSAYLLKVEPGTPFARQHMERQAANEDLAADLYLQAVEELSRMGLLQYEISNFARPGHESRHNLKYWACQEYLGFGPAAHSYFSGKRFCHPRGLSEYLQSRGTNLLVTDSAPGGFEETVMLGLRLTRGVDFPALCARFGKDPAPILKKAEPMARAGLLTLENGIVRLTPQGCLVSNAIIAQLALSSF